MTTVVLANDHHIVRQNLKTLLESRAGFHVVAEAGNGVQTVALVRLLQPEVLVLDWMTPAINSLQVTREVRKSSPKTSVVVLSMYLDEACAFESLRAGAKAYVLKTAPVDELIRAINEVCAGRLFLSSHLTEGSLKAYSQAATNAGSNHRALLTARESQVLELSAQGLSIAGSAQVLGICRSTVLRHRTNLLRKLGLRNQAELVCYAIRQGVVADRQE